MKIKLHHVNVCSKNVPGLEEFYRDVLDLQPEPSLEKGRILDKDGYPGKRRVPERRRQRSSIWPRRTSASASAPARPSIPSSAATSPSAPTTSRPSSSG